MTRWDFWGYRTEIDVEATRRWYAQSEGWDCLCGHCRNFLNLARERKLPQPVMDILDRLDIPPEKATYVCQLYGSEAGQFYQFSYRVAGKILNEGEAVPMTADWGEVRCLHETYPYGAKGFPEPHFDVEFDMMLPWVLDESP